MSTELERVVEQLAGFAPPEVLSQATGLNLREVRAIVEHVRSGGLSPEEKELAEKVRSLAHEVITFGHRTMRFGTMDQKMRVMSVVLSHAAKLIGQDNEGGQEEYRVAYQHLMSDMRVETPDRVPLVTDEGIIDVEAGAALETANDQE